MPDGILIGWLGRVLVMVIVGGILMGLRSALNAGDTSGNKESRAVPRVYRFMLASSSLDI